MQVIGLRQAISACNHHLRAPDSALILLILLFAHDYSRLFTVSSVTTVRSFCLLPDASSLVVDFLLFLVVEAAQLSEHIGEYEGLDYSQDSLRDRHSITRRSVYDKVIKLDIKAFGR